MLYYLFYTKILNNFLLKTVIRFPSGDNKTTIVSIKIKTTFDARWSYNPSEIPNALGNEMDTNIILVRCLVDY